MQHRDGPGPYQQRLRVDPTFSLELGFCDDHGIPHSELLSWDPVDRAKMAAYRLEKAARCQLCGTASWEWEADRRAYTPVEEICMGCMIKAQLEDGPHTPGQSIQLVPTRSLEMARRTLEQRQVWLAQQERDDD